MKLYFIIFLAGLMPFLSQAFNTSHLILPQGFSISVFAENVTNARQLAVSENGVVFVGSRKAGQVTALVDVDGDYIADKHYLLAQNLTMPSALAYREGDLYVAEVHRVLKFKNVLSQLNKPHYEVVFDGLPTDRHHGWKFIRFAPNGELIIPVGVPCNICLPTEQYGRIFSLNLASKKLTTLAQGVRNSVGFDFHPDTQVLWFSDNGRDMMGDDIPPDELNRITKVGQHFGYPYFHGGYVGEPEFSNGKKYTDYVLPAKNLKAHVAPLGIEFYTKKQFPRRYFKQLFVAEHGSWNRTKKSGYRVMLASINQGNVVSYEPFITGFMKDEKVFGRPVAFAQMADGSLLISDDFANVIYRVSYNNN